MTTLDYDLKARQALTRLYTDRRISEANKALMREFFNARKLSGARISIICANIKHLFYVQPDVVGVMHQRGQVNLDFRAIENLSKHDVKGNKLEEHLAETTIQMVKQVSKAVVRWKNDNQLPSGWKDIKIQNKKQLRQLQPQDMVEWDDGLKMADATNSIQMKAAIIMQLDGGFRPSEFMGIKLSDIRQDRYFLEVDIKGKTGVRTVILFKSVPYVQAWIRSHPGRNDKKNPLWIQEKGVEGKVIPYSYDAIQKRIRELASLAGIKKPMDFYNLRHSACYLSKKDNLNPELAARKFGHSVVFYTSTYGRLDTNGYKEMLEKTYNMAKAEEKPKNEPLLCVRCGTINEPNSESCKLCGSPITLHSALEQIQTLEQLRKSFEDKLAVIEDKFEKLADRL